MFVLGKKVCLLGIATGLLQCAIGCGALNTWNKTLPSSDDVFNQRGFRVARTTLHIHSPISYDACTQIDPTTCLNHLRTAVCTNRVDLVSMSDHPNSMATTDFSKLLLYSLGDDLIIQNGSPIGNIIHCTNSHDTIVIAGYENQLMPMGMTRHLETSVNLRERLYSKGTRKLVDRLRSETDAIVFMPHTETKSKTPDFLKSLNLDGIEIYNIHANVNPKIRAADLNFTYFGGLFDLLSYWLDPYGQQQPDLAFLSFMKVSNVYAQKWDSLIASGQHVVGIGGNDGHQSLFPGYARDGDKIDSYRRTIRWISNYFLVKDLTLPEIKIAIRKARGWVTFEGFGTPIDFDFHAESGSHSFEIGETTQLSRSDTKIFIHAPRLHSNSPQKGLPPTITFHLIHVDPSGKESIVATSSENSLIFQVINTGAYRVEVSILPNHLKEFVGYKKSVLHQEFKWIISNHIYVYS